MNGSIGFSIVEGFDRPPRLTYWPRSTHTLRSWVNLPIDSARWEQMKVEMENGLNVRLCKRAVIPMILRLNLCPVIF